MTVAASRPSSTSRRPPLGRPSQPRNGTRPHSGRRPSRAFRAPRAMLSFWQTTAAGRKRSEVLSRSQAVIAFSALAAVHSPFTTLSSYGRPRAASSKPSRRSRRRGRLGGALHVEDGATVRAQAAQLAGVDAPDLDVVGGDRRDRERGVLAPQRVHVGCGAVEEEPADAGPGGVAGDPLEAVGRRECGRGAPPAALPPARGRKRKSCWICITALSSAKRTSTSTPRRRPASRASSPCRAWYSWSALVRETTRRSAIGGDYRRSARPVAPADAGRRAVRPPPRRVPGPEARPGLFVRTGPRGTGS